METWRLLIVEDDTEAVEDLKDAVSSIATLEFDVAATREAAKELIRTRSYDFVVLDVCHPDDDEDAFDYTGISVLKSLQAERFVPVVFFTGYAHKIEDLASTFVKIVAKSDGAIAVADFLENRIKDGIPQTIRAVFQFIQQIHRDWMWGFVSNHWKSLEKLSPSEMAAILAKRLGAALHSREALVELERTLGGDSEIGLAGHVHPYQMYIVPPVGSYIGSGAVLRCQGNYYVVVTPSCDLVPRKATNRMSCKVDKVVLLNARPPEQVASFQKMLDNPQKYMDSDGMRKYIGNQRTDRYFFIPAAFSIPHAILDMCDIEVVDLPHIAAAEDHGSSGDWEWVGSLDAPFEAELITRFSRFYGRFGTPDVDTNAVISDLFQTTS